MQEIPMAILPGVFTGATRYAGRIEVYGSCGSASLVGGQTPRARGGYRLARKHTNVAYVALHGILFKDDWLDDSSMIVAREQLRAAADDERARAILLHIDSPGGEIAGTQDLADDVAYAASKKRVYAFCEDMCTGTAYWAAAAATKIYANNATAIVGAVGTCMAVADQSKQFAKRGLKVHVLRSGRFKGAGAPGTEVTNEQLAYWQKIIDQMNEFFLKSVAAGRKLSSAELKHIADGRAHVAEAAASLKLIDGIKSLDATIDELAPQTPVGVVHV